MIKNKEDLEKKVLEYNPELRSRIEEGDARAKSVLEQIADKEYGNYKPFIGGVSNAASSTGRVFGYVGDVVFWASAIAAATNPLLAPYMLTGLLLKKGQVAAQIPETLKTIKYGIKTGDYMGTIQNIGAKALSYIPGATILDRGLSRIAQRRMIKKTSYMVSEALGDESKTWYRRAAEEAEERGYKDVKVRKKNIIGPWKDSGELEEAA